MFPKPKTRTLAIALLALSILWMCALIFPLCYYIVAGNHDLKFVVSALEESETAPPQLAPLVEQVLAQGGRLKRAVPVGYYTGITATVRLNGTQTTKVRQVSYIAWFEKRPRPILLLISQYETNGEGKLAVNQGEWEWMSVVKGYGLPLVALVFCALWVRKCKSQSTPPA